MVMTLFKQFQSLNHFHRIINCSSYALINDSFNYYKKLTPFIQVRCFAARRGKRIAANRAKLLKAQKRREEAKLSGPKVWVPPHLRIDKSTLNIGPRRFSDSHLRDLSAIVDDVYVIGNYKERSHDLTEIISMHRQSHSPTMYNVTDALIEARIELELRTKKKTKFLEGFSGILRYPNEFNYVGTRKIVALCKNESDQSVAKEMGATIVGSNDIIKMLKVGDINMDDYDDLVCHGDILVDLSAIRGILGVHFPNKVRGNLGFDMRKLVDNFANGVEYKCVKDEFEPDYGWVQLAFGRLEMTDDCLRENLEHLLTQIDKHSPQGAPCKLITRVLISCPPTKEKFKLKFWDYIDDYPDPEAVQEDDANKPVDDSTVSKTTDKQKAKTKA